MGWLFCSSVKTKAEMIARLTRAERFDAGFELLKSTAVGNNHWYLIRRKEDGLISIGLDKMESGGREGWGYKDMSEFSGPCETNCPLSFLDAASEPTGYAVAWREKVRKHHAEKRTRPVLVAGLVVTYADCVYRLVRSAGPRRGWNVERTSDGKNFRMNCTQLARAQTTLASAPTPDDDTDTEMAPVQCGFEFDRV